MCTATCVQLHKRAEKIAAALMERSGINIGENVVLLYPPGKSHILCPLLRPVIKDIEDWTVKNRTVKVMGIYRKVLFFILNLKRVLT